MNVYTVTVVPKPSNNSGIGYYGSERLVVIVTDTLQDAMSIARSRIANTEEIAGIYTSHTDVIVDYSKTAQQAGQC